MMMPHELEAAFKITVAGSRRFTRRMAICMADDFGLTPRQIVLELERSNHLKPGSWDWFAANGGITREHIAMA